MKKSSTAGIAVTICAVIGLYTSSARAECQSDFKLFFNAFESSEAARNSSMADLVTLRELDLDQVSQPTWTMRNLSRKDALGTIAKGLQWRIGEIKADSAEATAALDGEDVFRYEFSRVGGCWRLRAVDDLHINFDRPVKPEESEASRLVRAQACAASGKSFESAASLESSDSPELFNRALYSYICSARAGSAEGAWLAARVATSGQSRALSRSVIEKLLRRAAPSVPEASELLADLVCGDGALCQHSAESLKLLLDAARGGNPRIINVLGVKFERGAFGAPDRARALACFRLASRRGFLLAAKNENRLLALDPKLKTTSEACLN